MANNRRAREGGSFLVKHWQAAAAGALICAALGLASWFEPEWINLPDSRIAQMIAAVVLAFFVARLGSPAYRGWALWRKRQGLAAKRWTLSRLMSMDWRDFETLTAVAFERQGWSVEQTGLGGADGGVDVVLRRGRVKALGQCKRHANAVGVKVAREILGEMHARGFQEAYVIAAAGFTKDAAAFAETCKKSGNSITLINGEGLIKMLGGLPDDEQLSATRRERAAKAKQAASGSAARAVDSSAPEMALAAANSSNASPARAPAKKPAPRMGGQPPLCPRCQNTMRPARAKQGPNAGQWFWGCKSWPQCQGTRPDDGRILAWASKRNAQKTGD